MQPIEDDDLGPELPTVPSEFAGKWVAWKHDQSAILGAARTFAEAYQLAIDLGETNPLMMKAPHADRLFIGGLR